MGEMVTFASNGHDARGHLAVPDTGSGPAVMVIQEWWGLNPQMKGVADFLAGQGFVALAPDLYHGELAGHDEMDKAGQLMTDLPPERAARDMSGAVDFLATHQANSASGVGVIGFCMGGLLSFMIAANRGDVVKAAVPFYGFPQGESEPDWGASQRPLMLTWLRRMTSFHQKRRKNSVNAYAAWAKMFRSRSTMLVTDS